MKNSYTGANGESLRRLNPLRRRTCAMKRSILLMCVLAGAAAVSHVSAQTMLYKSVGADGQTIYSDHPPGEGHAAKKLTFKDLPSSPLSASTLAFIEQLRQSAASHAVSALAGDVVLFSTAWCGYCKKAKAYLADKGIAYREVDIETSTGAVAYAQAGGQQGVPLLLAKGQRVVGFSLDAYDTLFVTNK